MADAIEQAILSSVEGMEGRDSDPGDEYPGNTPSGDETGRESSAGDAGQAEGAAAEGQGDGAAKAVSAAKAAEIQDKLAEELGINPKVTNRIPYTRVKERDEKMKKSVLDTLAKKFGVDDAGRKDWSFDKLEDILEAHYAKPFGETKGKLTEYEKRLQDAAAGDHLAKNDPDRFMEYLSMINPAFREYRRQQAQEEKRQEQQAAQDEQEPQPDYTAQDGSKGFTMDGARAYFQWMLKGVTKEHQAELKKLREEMTPIVEKVRARELNAEASQKIGEAVQRARQTLEGFAENEEAIARMAIDKQIGIEAAYHRVMQPIWKKKLEDAEAAAVKREQAAREKAIEEFKKAKPVTTSIPSGENGATSEKAESLEDIIKRKAHEAYGRK